MPRSKRVRGRPHKQSKIPVFREQWKKGGKWVKKGAKGAAKYVVRVGDRGKILASLPLTSKNETIKYASKGVVENWEGNIGSVLGSMNVFTLKGQRYMEVTVEGKYEKRTRVKEKYRKTVWKYRTIRGRKKRYRGWIFKYKTRYKTVSGVKKFKLSIDAQGKKVPLFLARRIQQELSRYGYRMQYDLDVVEWDSEGIITELEESEALRELKDVTITVRTWK